MPDQIVVVMKTVNSEASTGWHVRLAELGKGYKVSDRALPFGRVSVCVKHNGAAVILKQGGASSVRTLIENPTPAQVSIIADLRNIGMLCN